MNYLRVAQSSFGYAVFFITSHSGTPLEDLMQQVTGLAEQCELYPDLTGSVMHVSMSQPASCYEHFCTMCQLHGFHIDMDDFAHA